MTQRYYFDGAALFMFPAARKVQTIRSKRAKRGWVSTLALPEKTFLEYEQISEAEAFEFVEQNCPEAMLKFKRIVNEGKSDQWNNVMVCGTRHFQDYEILEDKLDAILSELVGPITILHGGASGADSMASRYAQENSMAREIHHADWDKHGKAAGPIRNQEMIDRATHVVAFWDGKSRGTKDSIDRAKKSGLPLRVVKVVIPPKHMREDIPF